MLSTEQAAAVLHGTHTEEWWEPVSLIENCTVPDWLRDADTQHLIGPAAELYSNRPSLVLLLEKDKAKWDERFVYENGCYIAESGDGRAVCHYHGPLVQEGDGAWLTRQEDGYGGRRFQIKMADGRDATLRGPWHGGAPRGYNDVHFTYWPLAGFKYPVSDWNRHEKPWRHQLCYSGLYVTDDVIVRAVSRFLPHLRLARVKRYYVEGLEPHLEGHPPKGMTWNQQRKV